MTLPADARRVVDAWLELVDEAAPGLVTGLHLRGGLGFGEFAPGSDVDMVAVLARRPAEVDIDALEQSHADLLARGGPPLDGIHVTAEDLAADPDDCPDVPCVLHGWFEPAGRFDLSPVAWHEVARHGITVRGELPTVWTDDARLVAFTRTTLATAWRTYADALAKFPAESATEAATWHVLGAARLHHLLVTGEMTAKSAAGRWGLTHYDERWHRVLREALRVREGAGDPQYDDPAERGADVAAFTAYVVDSGSQ